MTAQKGRLYLLKLGTTGAGGAVAGVRTTSVKINNEEVDITNKDSGGWRELLEGAGNQSVDIDVEGIVSDAANYETLQGYAQAASINGFQLINTAAGDTDAISGLFLISGWTQGQPHNKESTFSCTLKSSGAITFTNT